ncbi:MAG: YdcF family protein [Clostridia bacterium]|nr:YdcF family protein [Clostridia bacterium]
MKKLIKISLIVFLIFAIPVLGILSCILYYANFEKPQKSDVMIILGCQIWGRSPSDSLQYRLDKALELFKAGYAGHIIVSGGQGQDEETYESSVMKDYLVKKGIPEAKITEENKSTSTFENIKYSKKIMEAKDFRSAIIVSNDFHIFRSLQLAKRLDISASGAPAPSVVYLRTYYYSREIFTVVKSFLFDH